MDIKEFDIDYVDFRPYCPYCNKLVFALGGEDVADECERLVFIYDDWDDVFIKDSIGIKSSYYEALNSADEK